MEGTPDQSYSPLVLHRSDLLPYPIEATSTQSRDLTTGNIMVNDSARVQIGDNCIINIPSVSSQGALKELMASLTFPYMFDRFENVTEAYPDTYKWLLHPLTSSFTANTHDCFATWIAIQNGEHGLYWIHGKPGSGKSTIMKFLFTSLNVEYLTSSWPGSRSIITAHYFFWSSGTVLQKSIDGFYRSLILQILDQRPELLDPVLTKLRATNSDINRVTWSRMRLREALLSLVQVLTSGQRFNLLLIIDGLDECERSDEQQDELLTVLLRLARFDGVKICVASRAWNAMRDAFVNRPQLKLEDLTRADMEEYVTSKLSSSRRWRSMRFHHDLEALSLMSKIVNRAEGVFLWVRLVVLEILQGLRDGDDIEQLQQTLGSISPELDTYFMSILQAIEPKYLREASLLLQLALFEEQEYQSVLPVTLMDAYFMAEMHEDFAIYGKVRSQPLDLQSRKAFAFVIDSTRRKLVSRCKGLLECKSRGRDVFDIEEDASDLHKDSSNYDQNASKDRLDELEVTSGFGLRIGLLHRSLRDYLIRPNVQDFLHHHTGGQPLNARRFLSSARAMQLLALTSVQYYDKIAVPIASHLLSDLWVYRNSRTSLLFCEMIRDSIESLGCYGDISSFDSWYLSKSLCHWYQEQTNFLSVAIDFNISSYVAAFMTREAIKKKEGRPLLDYILRPRFNRITRGPGCQWVNVELIQLALERGSDPNEVMSMVGVSVWAAFLCFIADSVRFWGSDSYVDKSETSNATYQAMTALAHAGAARTFPAAWLRDPLYHGSKEKQRMGTIRRLWCDSEILSFRNHENERILVVSKLINVLSDYFQFDIQPLVRFLDEPESGHSS